MRAAPTRDKYWTEATCVKCGGKFLGYKPSIMRKANPQNMCPACGNGRAISEIHKQAGFFKSFHRGHLRKSVDALDPWRALAAAILLQAVRDLYSRDSWLSREACWWLSRDGPFYVEALDLDVDIVNWAHREYLKTWGTLPPGVKSILEVL